MHRVAYPQFFSDEVEFEESEEEYAY